MTFSKLDVQAIKWSLIIFLAALCASGAAIVASNKFAAHAQQEQHVAQRQLNTVRSQLAAANEDRENMKAYTLEYSELLRRNIIGDDQRLDWIEGLEQIRRQHRVLDFKYSFAPQLPYTLSPSLDSGNFKLNMTQMTLQFDLLHEEQLMDFFDTLRTGTRGWFILDRCSLERNTVADTTAQLKAECMGEWLTLKNRKTK